MYIMTLNPVLIVIRLVVKYIDTCHLVRVSARCGVNVVTLGTRMLEI